MAGRNRVERAPRERRWPCQLTVLVDTDTDQEVRAWYRAKRLTQAEGMRELVAIGLAVVRERDADLMTDKGKAQADAA